MLQRLIKIANALDELGYNELADEVDALITEAAISPFAWNPKADQADESRGNILRDARHEVTRALARAVMVIDQAPYAVFTVTLKKQKFGPFEVEYLNPHAKPFHSLDPAMAYYRENERYGREGYAGLQRKRETLRSSGDRELLKDVAHGGRPSIAG